MSPRARFAGLLVLTLLVLGVAFGYMGYRAAHWHERGWSGVYYLFGPQAEEQGRLMGLKPFEVMVTASGSPADGRLRYRDVILSLNGIPRDDVKQLRELDARTRTGSTVVYRVRRGKTTLDVPLTFASPLESRSILVQHAVAIIVALAYVVIALLIIARAPGDQRATVFFALALLSAVTILGTAATVYEQASARGIVTSPVPDVSSVYLVTAAALMYPPLILHLALIFPRRRPILEKHPQVIRWIYAATLLAVLSILILTTILVILSSGDVRSPDARIGALLRGSWYVLVGAAFAIVAHVLYAARREGVVRAIVARPFEVSLAVMGLAAGLMRSLIMVVPRSAAALVGGVAVVLPLLPIGLFPIFALIALRRSHRDANVEEKRQVAWPLWGLGFVVGGKILGFVVATAITIWATVGHFDMNALRPGLESIRLVTTILTLAIPISFAVAILKYRLMNIDVIIRKTVVYAILSGAIVAVYLGLVGGLGSMLVYMFGLENQSGMVIGATLVVALLFVPLRNRLQLLVDRNLFRHRYDYPDALKAISVEGRSAHDAIELLTSAAEKLQQALHNRALVIFAERQDEFLAVAKVGVADSVLGRLRLPGSFAGSLDRPFDPTRRVVPEPAASALAKIEAVLVVPVGTQAFIAAAPKLSGGGYDVEDIDFLRSVAEQLDGALDRIRMQAEGVDFAQASAIQQTLLPREMPKLARLDVSGFWKPARTMGGDYYDLIVLSESELAVCIGDVAGKGMPAALLMSGLQAAVRASASSSPRDLCERVRRVVVSSLAGGRFVTFFYATVDTAAMRLRWCNAGHNAPVLARADGTLVRLFEGGPAFSRLFRSDAYEERELALEAGDRLVLFTDGVSEACDSSGELFGEERIEMLVGEAHEQDASSLQRSVVEAATAFSGGELEDDLTLVVVRVTE
ncbi:MAG: SpoIIE family protein phosphatase [Acidobacteriota bacterium]